MYVISQDFDIKRAAVFLLSIYEAITLGYCNPRKLMDANVILTVTAIAVMM